MKPGKQTQRKSTFNGSPIDREIQSSSQLMELFEELLRDILLAEKASIKAIFKETNKQVTQLTKMFEAIQKKPSFIKSNAVEGLIAEVSEFMEDYEKSPKCDAGLNSAAQKIEHYEIANYGTLREFAETLVLRGSENLLLDTLNEEKTTGQKLTDITTEVVKMDTAVNQT